MSVRVLVVGAKPYSLGDAIATTCGWEGMVVHRVGISGEGTTLDVVGDAESYILQLFDKFRPDHVVCTVGINDPEPDNLRDPGGWYRESFETNVIGPMRLLETFHRWIDGQLEKKGLLPAEVSASHYVAISSNSARIPRSRSAAYCASKAALSMALRVKARDLATTGAGLVVYGYEPGLLAGTPMTAETERQFGGGGPLHRMRGVGEVGVPPRELARLVAFNLKHGGAALNGCLIPFDAGEV